jgi:cell division transport system permease protein
MASLFERVKINLMRERLLFVSNVAVMTFTFIFLGLFATIVILTQTALKNLEQQAQVTVFFKDDFSEQSILDLKTKFEQDARVSKVVYVSKEDAYKIFSEINANEPVLLDSISPSILPASLEISSKELKNLSVLSEEASHIDGVEEVKFFKDIIERFRYWSTLIYVVGFVLVGVFLVISYSIILVTLRTLITSKGKEIEIMKLVGASDAYVKRPLMLQGLLFGVISGFNAALVAIAAASLVYFTGFYTGALKINLFLPVDVSVNPLVYSLCLGVVLIISGSLLGLIGSTSAISKYLKY